MTDLVKLNTQRVYAQLKEVISLITPQQKQLLKSIKIYYGNKEVNINDIDFSKSLIFLCPEDLLGVISYFGLCKINNIHPKDSTTNGQFSRVRTKFMVVDSPEVKYARLGDTEFEEDQVLPKQWNPINYMTMDVVIWRLTKHPGLGRNETMYDVVRSFIHERLYNTKANWIFYTEDEESLGNTYQLSKDIPIYHITIKGVKSSFIKKNTGTKEEEEQLW